MIIIKYLIQSLLRATFPSFLHIFDSMHLNEFLHCTRQPLIDLLVDLLNLYFLLVLHDRKRHKTAYLTVLRLPVLPYRYLSRGYDHLKQLQIFYGQYIRTFIVF